jgi:hypothetical protein
MTSATSHLAAHRPASDFWSLYAQAFFQPRRAFETLLRHPQRLRFGLEAMALITFGISLSIWWTGVQDVVTTFVGLAAFLPVLVLFNR